MPERTLITEQDLPRIMPTRALQRALPKTVIAIGLGGGSTDLTVTWPSPMPSATYNVAIAGPLPAGVTAALLASPAPTETSCKIRVTSTGLLATGFVLDVTAWC